ncbi:hypothetical protein HPB47_014838 [Ixodes persulcatus]|uniref:Uncharacterized protein n=1 Tax=Ixodes persulcatus TaxID=34615 RepID=A0AC60QVX1_IXOPE|nr:hypothetical protein HPB47_014838 [Ixodes persulcatus]
MKILTDFLKLVDEMVHNHNTRGTVMFASPVTMQSLRVTLASLRDLISDLLRVGAHYVLTGKLNQDPLERFFNVVHSFPGGEDHPTVVSFTHIYRLLSLYVPIKACIQGNATGELTHVLAQWKKQCNSRSSIRGAMLHVLDSQETREKEVTKTHRPQAGELLRLRPGLRELKTPEAKEKLMQAGEIQVKGRRCLAIDPYRREVRAKLHWVTFDVPVDTVRRAFEPYGEVKGVVCEMWKVDGLVGVESTTLSVVLTLRQDLTLENLPHQLRFYGGTVLVVVPGRAPVCLRCRRIGHIRRECRAPWCSACRGFGHESTDCTRTYARAVAVNNDGGGVNEELMDEVEAEEAASVARGANSEGAHGNNAQAPTEAPNTKDEERQGKSEADQTSSTTQSSEDRTVPGSDTTKTSEGEEHDNDMEFNPAMIKRRHEGAAAAVAERGGQQPRQRPEQEGDDVKNKKSRGGSPRRPSSLSQGSPPPQ